MKTCTKCGQVKELDQFHRDCWRLSGRASRCKACILQTARRKYATNPEKYRGRKRVQYAANLDRERKKAKRWQIAHPESRHDRDHGKGSWEQRVKIIAKQGGKCPICKRKFGEKVKPVTDHCHDGNFIRGVLCSVCNLAEGMLKTAENARRMASYMEKNELFYQGQ